MTPEFFNLLTERISRAKMPAARLDYAVNRIIDTFTYRQLTIADILSMDQRCRLLTYSEMCDEAARRGATTSEYAPIVVRKGEPPMWLTRADKCRYQLPDAL